MPKVVEEPLHRFGSFSPTNSAIVHPFLRSIDANRPAQYCDLVAWDEQRPAIRPARGPSSRPQLNEYERAS